MANMLAVKALLADLMFAHHGTASYPLS